MTTKSNAGKTHSVDSLARKLKRDEGPDLLLREIGLRVLQRREELGPTQQNLADKLGITNTNIYRIEHGMQNLTVRTLAKVADALGVTGVELLGGS